ncbi:hypothetical protein F5883DRAFT_572065 [Diaporthe sp. PMI_573]|nr:hypothetical protein F5883DRAFT_572065 [Diaporthaceae sp. PMI_573]
MRTTGNCGTLAASDSFLSWAAFCFSLSTLARVSSSAGVSWKAFKRSSASFSSCLHCQDSSCTLRLHASSDSVFARANSSWIRPWFALKNDNAWLATTYMRQPLSLSQCMKERDGEIER